MKYGRIDLPEPENDRPLSCPFQPPQPEAPFEDGAVDASTHIRNVFYRMGFSNREIVALCGAHTIGRCFQERSGYVEEGYGEGKATQVRHKHLFLSLAALCAVALSGHGGIIIPIRVTPDQPSIFNRWHLNGGMSG